MNPEDYYKWHNQKKYVSVMDDIDELTRSNLLNAFNILETELGSSFLKRYSCNHSIRQRISNKAKWQIHEVIQFANVLQTLKSTESNYSTIIPKLLSEENSNIEGVPFVEIAHGYIKEDFKVWFIDEVPNQRTPDMKITNSENDEVFYVEVTTLNDRKERNNQRKDYDFFHYEFHHVPPQSSFCGKQNLKLIDKEIKEIKEIIAEAKHKVKQNQQILYYSDKRFNFIIAPITYDDEFQRICKDKNLRVNDIDGLPLRFDYVNQIRRRIGEKLTQIPSSSTGLIYININTIFFMVTDFADAITRIQESMSKSKEVMGVVICSKIVDSREDTVLRFEKHMFARRTIENHCYESLFIHNKNCKLAISNKTVKKIFKTFS